MSRHTTFRSAFAFSAIVIFLILLAADAVLAQTLLENLTRPIDGRSMRATSAFRRGADGKYDAKANLYGRHGDEMSNEDCFWIKPGETWVALDAKGPGMITHMWFTFFPPEPHEWAPMGTATNQDMLLRIYWDDEKKPGVEAPVGDFFCNAFSERYEVRSLPVAVGESGSYNCFWNMPFRKAARIEVVNQGDKPINLLYYNIDWIKKDSLPADTPYFYAQYRQEYPVENGKDYVILDTEGKGHFVGTLLSVRTRSPNWFGEGDEKIYIDGESKPSIWGTGTEDYFLQAWGLRKDMTPFFGTAFYDQYYRLIGSRISSYRWHLADPIAFQKSIKVSIEHYGWISEDENPDYKKINWNEREDDFSSVAYWYQTGIPTFTARAPGAKERHLPNIERVIVLAKDISAAEHHGPGEAVEQSLPKLYDHPQLVYKPAAAGKDAWVEIPFEVERKEPLRLIVAGTTSPDGGRYQAELDGTPIGQPLDFYAAEVAKREFPLLDLWPEAGRHTLRLVCIGRNKMSDGASLNIESVRLRDRRPRVEKYGHDKDKDWRKNPKLLYQ
ncbi:MAG TPA: glycoside hydrolase family 172 protein [Thermoguttaceae bacterium]|nr:glycoside hydrolase family 172 protein [Thermoguttaceae bacterium]